MNSFEAKLQKLQKHASEMGLRSTSDPAQLAFTYEREVIADLLHNQIEILKAIQAIDPNVLKNIQSGE
jgi:hypothetical protein